MLQSSLFNESEPATMSRYVSQRSCDLIYRIRTLTLTHLTSDPRNLILTLVLIQSNTIWLSEQELRELSNKHSSLINRESRRELFLFYCLIFYCKIYKDFSFTHSDIFCHFISYWQPNIRHLIWRHILIIETKKWTSHRWQIRVRLNSQCCIKSNLNQPQHQFIWRIDCGL